MQERWVSYIYRYKDNKRWENAGYIKVIRTSREGVDEAKVDIGLKLYKPFVCSCKLYFIYEQRELILLDEVLVPSEQKDTISVTKVIPWKGFGKEELTPKDYDGVFFAVDDGDTLMSLWKEKDINISELSVGEKSPKVGLIPIPEYLKMTEKSDSVEEQREEPESQPKESLIESLINSSVKLPTFIDSPFFECVKIVPQDIGRLPIGNWKLGQNSFLTHGYYRYRYIMLGKIKVKNRNQDTYVIGVPGVYTNKEKYLANMFGFSLFVPVKNGETKTGNFGYWVWEIVKE